MQRAQTILTHFAEPRPVRPLLFFLGALPLAGCGQTIFSPAGPVGEGDGIIMLDSLAIMLAIVVPTILATLAFAWWFRAGNKHAHRLPNWSYSGQLELLVWSVPALVVLFLGGIAWIGSHELDPAKPIASQAKPLEIEVVSLDWKWLFIYPQQGVASVNRLTIPAGVPLHFRITSASVFNVFFIPRLGSEIYAMNAMTSQLNLEASKPGVYPGLSAHFSGDGFAGMSFDAVAVPQGQFDNWVMAVKKSGDVLDEAAYRKLLPQSQNVKPYSYRAVQPGLFNAVVSQALPPGDGPAARVPAPSVSAERTN